MLIPLAKELDWPQMSQAKELYWKTALQSQWSFPGGRLAFFLQIIRYLVPAILQNRQEKLANPNTHFLFKAASHKRWVKVGVCTTQQLISDSLLFG